MNYKERGLTLKTRVRISTC